MDHYERNHIFFYQDFLYVTQNDNLRKLMATLRSLEKQRLSFLKDKNDLASFTPEKDESELLYLLLYRIFFHLFYLKFRLKKNEQKIEIETEIYHQIKAYLYVERVPIYLFLHYCLRRMSEPLNDFLLLLVKLLMTAIYFLFGWSGLFKKCTR